MEIKQVAQQLKQKLDETLKQNPQAPGYIFNSQPMDILKLTRELQALGMKLFEWRPVDTVPAKPTTQVTDVKWIVTYKK